MTEKTKPTEVPTGHRVSIDIDTKVVTLTVFGIRDNGDTEEVLLEIDKDTTGMTEDQITGMIQNVIQLETQTVFDDLKEALQKLRH